MWLHHGFPCASLWNWFCLCDKLGKAIAIIPGFFLLGWSFGLFGREPTARSPVVPPSLQILVITHEKARVEDMDDYFAKKLYPLRVMYVIGRSNAASPECRPDKTLFDAWQELVGRRLASATLSGFAQVSKRRMIFGA